MTKIERLDAVLNGKPVDRPPVCLWYHFFRNQHMKGAKYAPIILDWFHHYDVDSCDWKQQFAAIRLIARALKGNPSIEQMKKVWKGVVMAGIDNNKVTRVSTARQAGDAQFAGVSKA